MLEAANWTDVGQALSSIVDWQRQSARRVQNPWRLGGVFLFNFSFSNTKRVKYRLRIVLLAVCTVDFCDCGQISNVNVVHLVNERAEMWGIGRACTYVWLSLNNLRHYITQLTTTWANFNPKRRATKRRVSGAVVSSGGKTERLTGRVCGAGTIGLPELLWNGNSVLDDEDMVYRLPVNIHPPKPRHERP